MGPTAGQATPGSTAVGGNDRRALALTHGLHDTSTDGSAGPATSSDAVYDAGALDRRGHAAGRLSPDAPGWRAGSGRGHSDGKRHTWTVPRGRTSRCRAQGRSHPSERQRLVTRAEPRGGVTQPVSWSTPSRMSHACRLAAGSRMRREAHVRFCEGLRVTFPRSTHRGGAWSGNRRLYPAAEAQERAAHAWR
jgi:hypothetical protein